MDTKIIPQILENWEDISRIIPSDLDESAKEYGAITRIREIKKGEDLLRIILLYAMVRSLRLTALLAAGIGMCNITAQALQERIHRSDRWLKFLIGRMLTEMTGVPGAVGGIIKRIVLVDGSVIARPGSEGSEWRLHVAWNPVHLRICDVQVTGPEQGEGFERVALEEKDLVIADRGYGAWRHIKIALARKAFFLVRIPWNTLRLRTPEGKAFDIIQWLKAIPTQDGIVRETRITLADDNQQRTYRLIAGRLPKEKAAQAKARVRATAQKKGRNLHPHTLIAAEFCIVLTNLPAKQLSAATILNLYRIRWQVEWWFRRWKSVCELDVLPSYPAKIASPVLLAKILLVLILQQQIADYDWDVWEATDETPPALTRFVQLSYLALQHILIPVQAILKILRNPLAFTKHLTISKRRRRLLQFTSTRRLFSQLQALT